MRYKLSCGCTFEQESESIKDYDGLPPISIDYYNLPMECPRTWDLIGSGRTRGVFQLESNLGRSYASKLQPDNIDHLAALIAILRPGCMNSVLEGKSMTNHYVDRKNNREPVSYIDDRLSQYLDTTFGILVYQEQAIAIAKGLARFTPEQANALRKAIGKKKADELARLRDSFIAGCILSGLDPAIALQLFDNIESSNRYAFNASHSYTYSFITYATAYAKAHFPLHFFCAALKQIKDMDELKDLMSEVALFDLEVLGPSIANPLSRFNITNGRIQYGWSEIRKSGHKDVIDFVNYIVEIEKKLGKEAKEFTWYEFLILVAPEMRSDAMVNLISCGILDNTGVSRKEQLHEFNIFQELSSGDKKWILENYKVADHLAGIIQALIDSGKVQKKRESKIKGLHSTLQNPGKSLSDNVDFVCSTESELMGYTCSMSRTANKEKFANIKIYDFLLGKGNKDLAFVVEVKGVEERIIKTGKNAGKKMANVKLADRSGEMECSIFSADWLKQKTNVVRDNVLLIRGSRHQDMSLKIEDVSVI